MQKKYYSKIGLVFYLPLVLLLLSCIFIFIELDRSPLVWIINGSGLILIWILIIPTYYIIENETLIIKSGLFSKLKIDIKTIKKVQEKRSGLAEPALSLDRIEIRYKKYDHVMISPKDKYGFINDLKSINSDIEIILKDNRF